MYPPWRGAFYPKGLKQARELDYASRHVTTIEINATFYRTQKPAGFRRWAVETPDDFVFAVKASRYAVGRTKLADAGPSIERFFGSGVLDLGDKLGPILWQLAPFRRFDEGDLVAFLALLPRELDGRRIRHALEVRHPSFRDPQVLSLASSASVAIVFTDSEKYPSIADLSADFVYARLQRCSEAEPTGYPPAELDRLADRLRTWAAGGEPTDLPKLGTPAVAEPTSGRRDCFVYVIDGAKVRAPAAAMALLQRLG